MITSAREYYYKLVAPDESGKSYQAVHQSDLGHLFPDESWGRIVGHGPNRSNDFLIEGYIDELIELNEGRFSDRLKSIFVAKRRIFKPNASAVFSESKFFGDLIFFNVGLSDACFQYAILFAEFTELTRLRGNLGDADPVTRRAFAEFCENLIKIKNAQEFWAAGGNDVRLKEESNLLPREDIADLAAGIACLMDKQILRHEIAHHFLGHTGNSSVRDPELAALVEKWQIEGVASASHHKEYEADIGAIYLSLSDAPTEDRCIDVALGSLLSVTVLGQFYADVTAVGITHPSVMDRFKGIQKVLESIMGDKGFYSSLESDVHRFQALLFLIQSKGLGVKHDDIIGKVKS